jgi:hypothetical protein
MLFLEKL